MQFDLKSGIKDLLKNYEFHDFDNNTKNKENKLFT